jgi:hypothetical protein
VLSKRILDRLTELAEIARVTCKTRHDKFVLAAKNEINVLVRKAMNDGVDPLADEVEEWEGGAILTNGSIMMSDTSENSDPLGNKGCCAFWSVCMIH